MFPNKDSERLVCEYLDYHLIKKLQYHKIINPDNVTWKLFFERDYGCIGRAVNDYEKLYEEVRVSSEEQRAHIAQDYNIERLFDNTKLIVVIENIKSLIDKHPLNVHYRTMDGKTRLMRSCMESIYSCNMDILQFLIDKGADIHAVDYQNEDALYISFTQMLGKKLGRFPKYYKEVAKFLIDKGADINRRYKKEETLLMIITRLDNDVDNIIFLLDNGANPNLKNSTGETALAIAKKAPKKKESIIKYLQNVTNMEI